MENSKADIGDKIVVKGGQRLPVNWEKYIGEEFIVTDVSENGDAIHVDDGEGAVLVLVNDEYDVVSTNSYEKQKSELNV